MPPRPRPVEPPKQEFTRTEIKDNATLTSGDLIEVELTLDADNDYSYLVFEDMKAAGLEPVDIAQRLRMGRWFNQQRRTARRKSRLVR